MNALTPEALDEHLRDAGLIGWKAKVNRVAGDVVAVLTPPDFNPVVDPRRMCVGRGDDHATALAHAIDRARTVH